MKSLSSTFFTTLFLLSFLPVFAQDTLYCVDLHQPDFEHYDPLLAQVFLRGPESRRDLCQPPARKSKLPCACEE